MTPALNTKHLLGLAAAEALVLLTAVRQVVSGAAVLDRPLHLAWFIAVVGVSAMAIAQFVVRSTMLAPRVTAKEDVTQTQQQILFVSIAMLVLIGAVAIGGPALIEQLASRTP